MTTKIKVKKLFSINNLKKTIHLTFLPLLFAFKVKGFTGAVMGFFYFLFALYVYLFIKEEKIEDDPVFMISSFITLFFFGSYDG